MINNKGFAKFEVLTVIVLLICIGAFLLYQVLGGASSQQLSTMRDSASNFAKAVNADSNSFVNSDNVYLDEAIDSGLMNSISSPFGGKCDGSETKYFMNDGTPSVTLKCGKYLINEESVSSIKRSKIYKVSDWTEKELTGSDIEKKELYNCKENGKEIFDDYMEDGYFVYQTNKKYGTSNFYPEDVKDCNIVTKTFYRKIKEVK